jgi:hypothetical protein
MEGLPHTLPGARPPARRPHQPGGQSGKEQSGNQGDYLVECSDGSHRIAPRQIFEDIYVEMSVPLELRMFPLIRSLRKHHVVAEDDPSQPVLFSLTG